ncbi:MAG: fimbrillin family protein [Bacteroidales bacterium]
MKKTMLGFAACALILSSCSQNEELIDNTKLNQEEINFAPYVNKTKASVIGMPQLKDTGFKIFALQHDAESVQDYSGLPIFMNQLKEFWNNKWEHTGIYYWPETSFLSFFAVAPYLENEYDIKNTGQIEIPLIIKDDVSKQKDILAASALNKKRADLPNNQGRVDFQFKHILSRIGFKASMDANDNLKFKITELKYSLNNVISSGSYKYKEGTIQNSTGKHATTLINLPMLSNRIIGGTVGGTKVTNLTLNDENSYLMILPQTVANAGIKLEVKYMIAVAGDAYGTEKTAIIELPEQVYAMGKAYTHTLKFSKSSTGGDDLLEVKFDVTNVEPWGDETNQDTNVPKPTPPTTETK